MSEPASQDAIRDAVQEVRRCADGLNRASKFVAHLSLQVRYRDTDDLSISPPGRAPHLEPVVTRVETY